MGLATAIPTKEKFRSDLDRPESCEMSERLLKTLRKSGDFQADHEGSIPFTRSNPFRKIPIQEPIGDKMRRNPQIVCRGGEDGR